LILTLLCRLLYLRTIYPIFSISVELIKYLILFSDQLHVLPLQIMFFIGQNYIESRLLLCFVHSRALVVLKFDAERRGGIRFHLDALLTLDWTNGELTWSIEAK